jgi:putative MATE family efflux protein
MSISATVQAIDHRDVRGTLVRLAVPTFAAIIGDQLLGIADTIVIGTLGAPQLAAMTGATSIFIALVLGLHGASQGAGILAAQAAGAGDFNRFGRIVRASVIVPMVLATAVIVAALGLADPAMNALLGPLPTVHAAAWYLTVRCFSLIPALISGIVYTVFGAAGDTGFGFRLLVAINVIHVPLLLVLALGWGTHHPLGIAGAGISSACSEAVGAVFSLIAVGRRPRFRIFSAATFDLRLAARIFWLGLPEAIYLMLIVAPDIAIVAILAPLGAETVAAFRVIAIVSDATWSVPGSLSAAAQIVIGQRFGAGDVRGARSFDRGALQYGISLSALCGIVIAALAWPVAFACTLDARLASIAALPLGIHMLTLPLKGYAMLGIARVRAAGDTRFSMLVGVLATAIVIPGTWAGVHLLHAGLYAVPLAWIVAWLFWCGATALRLRRFDWNGGRLAA